ncbi:MAG: ABC transporter ATP-binding protein [Lachnospiraceae bacterium]|nr:ABC transporter ATP-binding protein [Lachnospiraceae bacterium]
MILKRVNKLIYEYYKADKIRFIMLFIISIMIGIVPYVYVKVYSKLVDGILEVLKGDRSIVTLMGTIAAVIGVYIFNFCQGNVRRWIRIHSQIKVGKTIYTRILEKYVRVDYKNIESEGFQELFYNVINGIKEMLLDGVTVAFELGQQMLEIVSVIVIVMQHSWIVGTITLVCFVPVIVIAAKRGADDYEAFRKFMDIERRKASYEEMLVKENYVNERKIYAFTDWIEKKWADKTDEGLVIFCGAQKKSMLKIKKNSIIIEIILWVVIGALIVLYSRESMTLGTCTILISQIIALNSRLAWYLSARVYALGDSASYMGVYEEYFAYPERDRVNGSEEIGAIKEIEFKNLSFRYSDDTPYIIKDLNYKLDGDKNYAVVGKNGAGKTTLMKLLTGVYDNYEGEILVNGVELRKIKGNPFSAMFQDYSKYEISIRDNILLNAEKSSESMDRIREAMKLLQLKLDESIYGKTFEKELGRLTDENRELSGGMWQKLAMIRAIMQDKSYYIFDEPTSALDPIVENEVYNNLAKMMRDRHALLVTHRLGAARLADKIIVIKDGKIVETGSHEELVKQRGEYAEMFEVQKGWYVENEA